jgi:hypothetical protein
VPTIGQTRPRAYPPVTLARRARLVGGGTIGNERLTALTGAALLILLAILGITILQLRPLLSVHLFLGMLLIPPVLLKLASTGYRIVRYYTRDGAYRLRGAPPTALRVLGPVVVLTTFVVFASGVVLLFVGPSSRGVLLPLHKVSFIAWLVFTGVHVLAHAPTVLRALGEETGRLPGEPAVAGRDGRALALTGALAAGVVLAVLLVPEFSAWLSWSAHHFHGDH